MNKTWTKNDLIEKIQSEIGISLSDSSKIFEEIIEEILFSLENGNDVKISNFGTFSVKKKNSRIGRNPKTGDEKEITARNVISFYPSKIMKNIRPGTLQDPLSASVPHLITKVVTKWYPRTSKWSKHGHLKPKCK